MPGIAPRHRLARSHPQPGPLRRAAHALTGAALTLACCSAIASGDPGVAATGRWTGTWDWDWTPVHLLLVPPGASGYHSRLVWWEDDHRLLRFKGGMWGWMGTAGSDCSTAAESLFRPIPSGADPTADVFCGGQAQMMDGRVLVTGGTEDGETGIPQSFVFDADATGSQWLPVPDLDFPRWYPTNTRLADGSMLVTSGSQYSHLHFFGGRHTGTGTVDAALRRLGLSRGGVWDTPHTDTSDPTYPWPPALEAATLSPIDSAYARHVGYVDTKSVVSVLFGGNVLDPDSGRRRSIGDAWFPARTLEQATPDYGYYYKLVSPKWTLDGVTSPDRLPRSDHTTTSAAQDDRDSASVYVFGGRRFTPGSPTEVLGDLWRFYWHTEPGDPSRTGWTWQDLGRLPGAPSPRFAHSACYDPFHRRILVFGGTADSATALDDVLYALDVRDAAHPVWSLPVVTGDLPAARFGQRMDLDRIARVRVLASGDSLPERYFAVMYGGRTATGLDDQVDVLWIDPDPDSLRLEWQHIDAPGVVAGVVPGGRASGTFIKDPSNDGWLLFGGETGGVPDPRPWRLRFRFGDATHATWERLDQDADASLTGSCSEFIPDAVFQRVAEVYSPDGASHASYPGSLLAQEWYPFTWVLPDESVFALALGDTSYRLVRPGLPWQHFPAGDAAAEGINGASGVMVRPGRVLTAGTRVGGVAPTAEARWIEPLAADAAWRPTANTMRWGRSNLNLVMLPNGQALAIGGTWQTGGESDTAAVRTPELFDPDYVDPASGRRGRWYDADTLAPQAMCRDYHSTALLMPDGRILSAGGNSTADRIQAELYCPPYLFRPDGTLAPRPVIDVPVAAVHYGRTFPIATQQAHVITRVALLAPGAPTHAFDENQRYVPLAFQVYDDPPRLEVMGPAGPGVAPPGWYLLFLTGGSDDAGRYPDVPSFAQWVRVGGRVPDPSCDGVRPDTVGSVAVDCVSTHAVYLAWDAPPRLDSLGLRCPVTGYELRYRQTPFDPADPTSWSAAIACGDVTGPDQEWGSGSAQELSPATTYYFAVRAADDATTDYLSDLDHAVTSARTLSDPLHPPTGPYPVTLPLLPDSGRVAVPVRLAPVAAAGFRVAVARAGADWRIAVTRASDGTGAGVTPAGPGATADGALGVCALRDGVVREFAAGLAPQAVARAFATPQGGYRLAALRHSRAGAIDPAAPAAEVPPLAASDTLTLDYAPDPAAGDAPSWYLLLTRGGAGDPVRSPAPAAFALEPNRPNPFAGSTTVRFDLPVASRVRLEVFDLLGRRVRTLTDADWPAGVHELRWDRRDHDGRELRAGVFLCRMTAGGFVAHRKLVIAGE